LAYAALLPPLAAFFCLRVGFPMHVLARFGDNPLMSAGFWTARLTAFKVIGKYLWLFVWPAHLSADYSYNAVPLFGWQPVDWEDAKALIALAVCLGAAVLAVRWYRTRQPLFFESGGSHRQHHGRAVRVSAFHRAGRVRGRGHLRARPAGLAPAALGHASRMDCARAPDPGVRRADLCPKPRLA
jgi:hypothetical protein